MEQRGAEPKKHPGITLLDWLQLSDLVGQTLEYNGRTFLAEDFMEIPVCKQHISPLMRGLVAQQKELGQDHPEFQQSLKATQAMIRGHFQAKADE